MLCHFLGHSSKCSIKRAAKIGLDVNLDEKERKSKCIIAVPEDFRRKRIRKIVRKIRIKKKEKKGEETGISQDKKFLEGFYMESTTVSDRIGGETDNARLFPLRRGIKRFEERCSKGWCIIGRGKSKGKT